MKLIELNEITFPSYRILEESEIPVVEGGKKFMHFIAEIQRADTKNRNGRVYPRRFLEREVQKINEKIKANACFGEADHPVSGSPSITRTAVMWEKLWMESDGRVMGQAMVLDTAVGRDLRAILEAKGKPGVSSRGQGSVTVQNWQGEQAEVVNEDLDLRSFDVVIDQSVHTAVPQSVFLEQNKKGGIMEGVKTLEDLKAKNPELHASLMKEAVDQAATQFEPQLEAVVEAKRAEIIAEERKKLSESGELTEDVEASKLRNHVLDVIVETLTESGLIKNETVVSDEEAKAQIESLKQTIAEKDEQIASLTEALNESLNSLEEMAVKEAIEEAVADHVLADEMKQELVESCENLKEFETRFPTVKARYDGLATRMNKQVTRVGRSNVDSGSAKETAPVAAKLNEQAKGGDKTSDRANAVLQRVAGLR